jgi:hypothetical protein
LRPPRISSVVGESRPATPARTSGTPRVADLHASRLGSRPLGCEETELCIRASRTLGDIRSLDTERRYVSRTLPLETVRSAIAAVIGPGRSAAAGRIAAVIGGVAAAAVGSLRG